MYLQDVTLMNDDFRNVIKKINFSDTLLKKSEAFIYLDPIYLNTTHFYKVPKWTIKDTEDCFKIMATSGIPSALSEFDNDEVLKLAADYNMNVIYLKERRNINNRRTEILVTNYTDNQLDMFKVVS